jgi:carbonic anhydrase
MLARTLLIAALFLESGLSLAQEHAPHSTTEAGGGTHLEWGYLGPSGPEHWAELSGAYRICASGEQESPIDLKDAVPARLGKLTVDWRPIPLRAVNNGHAVQVDAPAGSALTMAGKRYELQQFHFHHPSEHLLNGRRFPLEVHFVHRAADGTLGVLGVMVELGQTNPVLQAVLDATPREKGATRARDGDQIDPRGLLPGGLSEFFRYEGSLTTPPCTENVDWVLLRQPIQASPKQIEDFEGFYAANARPIQALNRRFLLESQ